jgi:hypothetical protein
MFKEICSVTPWIEDTSRKSLRERDYCIKHNLKDFPKCEICSGKTKFSRSNNRYSTTCSKECKKIIVKNKVKETCLERYGVEFYLQSEDIKEKTKETCLKKYGVENPQSSKEVKEKIKETNLERYGVEYASQSEEIREKSKQTCFNHFGVNYPGQSEEVKNKMKQTCLKKYGVEYNFQDENVKNKIKQTNFERYGHENPAHGEKAKEKIKETNLERFGFEHHWESEEIRDKIKQTRLGRYGVEYPAQSAEVRDKMSISLANNFQARRNDEGTDYSGSVYILHFPEHKAVKIGLTSDFDQRSKGLISDFGEYNIIDITETQKCYALESSLHEKFKDYRMCLDEGCGRTEFFSENIISLYK